MEETIDWQALVEDVGRRHGTHTILLYGSRARGDANEDSDVDLIGVRPSGGPARDVGAWRGLSLDLHLHDEADVPAYVATAPDLRHARVLAQRDGLGDRILAEVRARLAEPPKAMTVHEAAALWAWGEKMRKRVRSRDATLAALQRAVLLVESLGAWAEVRGRRFFGGKSTLGALATEDPATLAAFREAARPGAPPEAFDRLLDAVFDERLRPPPP